VKRRPKLALMIGASLLTFPLAACDGGSTEPDGNDGEATPTAPPTDDDDTGGDSENGDSENDDDGSTDPDDGGDDDGGQGPDGSGDD
jgi:hypothetical protein